MKTLRDMFPFDRPSVRDLRDILGQLESHPPSVRDLKNILGRHGSRPRLSDIARDLLEADERAWAEQVERERPKPPPPKPKRSISRRAFDRARALILEQYGYIPSRADVPTGEFLETMRDQANKQGKGYSRSTFLRAAGRKE
jgi:hypothetical protein